MLGIGWTWETTDWVLDAVVRCWLGIDDMLHKRVLIFLLGPGQAYTTMSLQNWRQWHRTWTLNTIRSECFVPPVQWNITSNGWLRMIHPQQLNGEWANNDLFILGSMGFFESTWGPRYHVTHVFWQTSLQSNHEIAGCMSGHNKHTYYSPIIIVHTSSESLQKWHPFTVSWFLHPWYQQHKFHSSST